MGEEPSYLVEPNTRTKFSPGTVGRSNNPGFIGVWRTWPLTSECPCIQNDWGLLQLRVRPACSSDSPLLVASSFLHSLTMLFDALICKIGVSPSMREPTKEAERGSGRVPAQALPHSGHSVSIRCYTAAKEHFASAVHAR